MKSFKDIAHSILQEARKPLHYREITNIALEKGLLKSEGKTPWATMNAQLSMDIKNHGDNSRFRRSEPGKFAISSMVTATNQKITSNAVAKHPINKDLNTKQKGDIAEARVAELITLYGNEGLSCYRPVSDDEGIDIIVKRRGSLEVVYIQVKSTFGYGDRGFVSTVREKSVAAKDRMIMVFVYFDLSSGDLYDHIFCISGPDFLRLTHNEHKKPGHRVFTVNLNRPEKSKYAEYMIEKRELANRILEIMNRLQ